MADEPDRAEALWEAGHVRAFISHVHTKRILAGELREALARYGIDAFVAHDDIEPTREWEAEIETALRSCEVLLVLLGGDTHASNWLDQETGWALGRGISVIPIRIDVVPYGFIGGIQAVPGTDRTAEDLADTVFNLLLTKAATAPATIDAMVTRFENTESYDDARWKFDRLDRLPALTEAQLGRVERAFRENRQLREAFYVQNRIAEFLRAHWAAYGVDDYQMADDDSDNWDYDEDGEDV